MRGNFECIIPDSRVAGQWAIFEREYFREATTEGGPYKKETGFAH